MPYSAWQNSAIDQRSPTEDRAFQLQLLRDVTNNALYSHQDEFTRDTLVRGSEALEYFWFGNDETPLPSGLRRFSLPHEDTPLLALNPYTLTKNFTAVMKLLRNAGLNSLLDYRQNLYESQSEIVFEPLARAVVANTPGYRLLESFISTQSWEERPLTAIERLIEEQAIEQRVRRQYGLSGQESLRMHFNAFHGYSRAVFHLDEETRHHRAKLPDRPPIERARNFFSQLIIDDPAVKGEYLEDVRVVELKDPSFDKPLRLLEITTDEEHFRTDTESVATFAETADLLSVPTMSRARTISSGLLGDMIMDLFDTNRADRDYAEVLETLLALHTKTLIEDTSLLARGDFGDGLFSALATLLVMPAEADETVESPYVSVPSTPSLDRNDSMVSRKEYRRASRESHGKILKRPFEDYSTRVMQYRSRGESLTNPDEAADMVVELPDIPSSFMPHIPGYTVTGYSAERHIFGLQYTPEADPYTECTTRIPDASRVQLAHRYADMGLHELATLVHETSNLTVSQLAELVSKTNRYKVPTESVSMETPSNLEDFADQVKKGRLDLQCVGSSHFLRLSLQSIFGPHSTGVIAGDTIPENSFNITAVSHQQTTFIDPESGRLYIIDSTSGSLDIALWRSILSEQIGAIRRGIGARALRETEPERSAPVVQQEYEPVSIPTQANEQAYRDNLLEQTKESVILQLRMALGKDGQPIPHDLLFERVVRYGSEDILFRTLSAFMVAEKGMLSSEEAARLLRYIEALRDCRDPAILRKVDPRRYVTRPHLLSILHAHISQLNRLVE